MIKGISILLLYVCYYTSYFAWAICHESRTRVPLHISQMVCIVVLDSDISVAFRGDLGPQYETKKYIVSNGSVPLAQGRT